MVRFMQTSGIPRKPKEIKMAEKPVTLAYEAEKSLVTAVTTAVTASVVEAVTKANQVDQLEQYKAFARQETELTRAREELARKDAEIARLQGQIVNLNGFIANLTQGGGSPVYNPYNNNGPAVTTAPHPYFPEQRHDTFAPLPSQPNPWQTPPPPAPTAPSAPVSDQAG